MSELIHVGTVVRPRGTKGEMVVDCPGAHPERLVGLREVLVGPDPERSRPKTVRRAWVQSSRLVLHLEGTTSIEDAEVLRGARLFVERACLPALPENTWYTVDLVGCDVVDRAGRRLGHVVDTVAGAAQDRLVVEAVDGRRVEVPMARELLLDVDVAHKRVRVDLPAGLLEGEPETVLPVGRSAGERR